LEFEILTIILYWVSSIFTVLEKIHLALSIRLAKKFYFSLKVILGKLLGYTNPSTTQRYAHLADEPLRKAAELFGSKIGELSSKEES
jgi:hypothetical protein